MKHPVWKSIVWLLGAAVAAALFFALLFRFENKYTARAPVAQDGAALVSAARLTADRLTWLAEGWELYPDALLAPNELKAGSGVPVYVGQYLNFAPFHADRSPYGYATWRLRLRYEGEPVTCSLLLPEVFSACRVYLNGEPIAGSGSLEPYDPLVRDLAVSFELQGDSELVVQTANFSHYYSGITYPPALGSAVAMQQYTGIRLGFYGFFCFTSLAVSLFSAAVWFGSPRRNRLMLWFAILSLSFSVRVCYPFVRLLGAPMLRPLYALEDAASMVGIWCALHIALALCGWSYRRWAAMLLRVAGAMALVAVAFPLWVLPSFSASTAAYGWFISLYKLLTAAGLCILAVVAGVNKSRGSPFLLAGVAFYGVSLAANIVTIGSFEPAYTSWQDEYGMYFLVLCFAALMVWRTRLLVWENERLTSRLQEEVRQKTTQVSKLLEERSCLLAELIHDIKSPASTILTYTQLIRENQVELDAKTNQHLQIIEEKCHDVGGKIQSIQMLATQSSLLPKREPLELGALLAEFHRKNQPDVQVYGPDFLLRLPQAPCPIWGDRSLLERMLQNLVYNAVGFTPPDGKITLLLERDEETAIIRLVDTGCGIPAENLPRLFDRFFTTRADEGGKGLGLYIVKTVVVQHEGQITVKSRPGHGSEFIVTLPLAQQPPDANSGHLRG